MTKQELVERMQQGQAWVPGKRVKIDFGDSEGPVDLDRRLTCFLRDPDGNVLEFNELVSRAPS